MSSDTAAHGLPPPDIVIPRRSTQAAGKRKRVVLSIHEKQQVLARLEGGEPPATLSKAFGISRQQVSDIKKNKQRILSFCIDAKHLSTLRRKTLKATAEFHPGVEQELYRWIIRERKLGREVANEDLVDKTSKLFTQYSAGEAGKVSFRTIDNWLRHFKRAHGIKLVTTEELEKLPQEFVPAMDVASDNVPTSGGVLQTGSYVPPPLDVNPYLIQTHQAVVVLPTASLQATVNTVHQMNEQLARFEHDMAAKLDYLDERVAKLCYLVLPPRLS